MHHPKIASIISRTLFACALLPLTLPGSANAAGTSNCKALSALTDADLAIVSTEHLPATDQLPAHCRVHGFIHPAVNFELKLPDDWNGKFFMVGNGGYLGVFFDQSYGLARGYATASTDTGHQGPDPRFAMNNRAAEVDFAFRAIHVTNKAAKQLVKTYYGQAPAYSYYRGCSTGGRQGLMEAQRFPDDFDGWSIGAPIYDYTFKQTYNAAWVAQVLYGNNLVGYVPKEKLKALGEAVYARCDGIDGLDDGLIDDPRDCTFDPKRHLEQCATGDTGDDCFTPAQIDAIARIYDGPGADVYPGAVKGGESLPGHEDRLSGGWDVYFTGMERKTDSPENELGQRERDAYGGDDYQAVQLRNGGSFFRYLAFEVDRPEFDFLTDLDFDNVPDVTFMAKMMNAADPDLSRVLEADKKIIMWHGWADVGLNPLRTIAYYEQVQDHMGTDKVDEFLRLYLVPGMYHCSGGPGPDVFDDLTALEQWVEEGSAPDEIIAYKTMGDNDFYPDRGPRKQDDENVVRSRPLCPYPGVAKYSGSGSIDNAENFSCIKH